MFHGLVNTMAPLFLSNNWNSSEFNRISDLAHGSWPLLLGARSYYVEAIASRLEDIATSNKKAGSHYY